MKFSIKGGRVLSVFLFLFFHFIAFLLFLILLNLCNDTRLFSPLDSLINLNGKVYSIVIIDGFDCILYMVDVFVFFLD